MGNSDQLKRLTLLLKLLQQNTSLPVLGTFLKSKGAPKTIPTWDSALELRIIPALEAGQITEGQLLQLLADAEEHGRHHVYLYRVGEPMLSQLLDPKHASKWAKARNLELNATELHDMPAKPMVSSVRNDGQELVVKIVEQREYHAQVDEDRSKKDFVIKTYQLTRERAVNVVRLRRKDGLLELRIRSRRNTTKYQGDLDAFWRLIHGLIDKGAAPRYSLQKSKNKLLSQKVALKSEIRYSDSVLKNDHGVTITAASGTEQQSLFEDAGALDSTNAFLARDGFCEMSNIWWIEQKTGVPSKDVHVLLGGDMNEFAVTAACTKADYEFVLDRILRHGK